MNEILRHAGAFTQIGGFGQDGSLIFTAATTCYRSETKTAKGPDEIITMLKRNGHTAMLEFCWFPVVINIDTLKDAQQDRIVALSLIISSLGVEHYLEMTARIESGYLLVSGNARAWIEFISRVAQYYQGDHIGQVYTGLVGSIAQRLRECNGTLFDMAAPDPAGLITPDHITIISDPGDSRLTAGHQWLAFKLHRVSRGLTHELVRHRVLSFAQESTRYVKQDDISIVMDDGKNGESYASHTGRIEELLGMSARLYASLLESGVRREVARQILPTGLLSEICVAGRLTDWAHVFELRCADDAAAEIRSLMRRIRDGESSE